MAGSDVGGRAPVFTLTQNNPDEGQKGGDLQPRGAAGGMTGKIYTTTDSNASYYVKNNPINNNTPVYASPPD